MRSRTTRNNEGARRIMRNDARQRGGREETRLELPTGTPDIDGLRSIAKEWLVPRLVEKFLLTHGIELRSRSECA